MKIKDDNLQDDQELARVLASIEKRTKEKKYNDKLDDLVADDSIVALDKIVASDDIDEEIIFEEIGDESDEIDKEVPSPSPAKVVKKEKEDEKSMDNIPSAKPNTQKNEPTDEAKLDALKKKALKDLRPIVDKIGLDQEELFDVLLLLIREIDDASLLPKAYEVAREIKDEGKRARALLDVIKEADYFKTLKSN